MQRRFHRSPAFRRVRKGLTLAGLGLLGTAAVALTLFFILKGAGMIVMLHDISTDLEDPPAFEALLPLRQGAANPPGHGGRAVADLQRQAYPGLAPLLLPLPMDQVFPAAEQTARAMGWQIVAADGGRGRLEAVATTRILRFRDDVVVRLRPATEGTRVDVRSKSRVGKSDFGANARRIRAFLQRLRETAPAAP